MGPITSVMPGNTPITAQAAPTDRLEILLFTHDTNYAAAATAAGISAVVVDWEWTGKSARQSGWNTEINQGTEADLIAMRRVVAGKLICRINNHPTLRIAELRRAAQLGANEVLLPMVRSVTEVEECLAALPNDCSLGILAETAEALALAEQWARLPLSRVYLGLNDLQIDTGRKTLFEPLADGSVETFRERYGGPFGFAGVTRPDLGSPVPCRLLLAEMARQSCSFAVARRSFRADIELGAIPEAVRDIRGEYAKLSRRHKGQVAADRENLLARLNWLAGGETREDAGACGY